jgi:hypothetical protein
MRAFDYEEFIRNCFQSMVDEAEDYGCTLIFRDDVAHVLDRAAGILETRDGWCDSRDRRGAVMDAAISVTQRRRKTEWVRIRELLGEIAQLGLYTRQ